MADFRPTDLVPSAHDRSTDRAATAGAAASDVLDLSAPVHDIRAGEGQDALDTGDVSGVCGCCGAPRSLRRGRRVGVITLPMLPKTMNEREGLLFAAITKKRPGMAHVVRDETRKIYAALQRAADELDDPASGQRIVQITFVKSPRSTSRDDPGNRMVRAKALLDGLVHADLLIDDTDEFLVLPPAREEKAAHGPQTIIEIHETERR